MALALLNHEGAAVVLAHARNRAAELAVAQSVEDDLADPVEAPRGAAGRRPHRHGYGEVFQAMCGSAFIPLMVVGMRAAEPKCRRTPARPPARGV